MPEPTVTKRTRRPRRNYQKEIEGIEAYCRAAIDVLRALPTPGRSEEGITYEGQILAYKNILDRITGSANGK